MLKRFLISIGILALLIIWTACQGDSEKQQDIQMEQKEVTGELSYQVPQAWSEVTPDNRMRKAQFVLPGADGGDNAELAVYNFPGTGGSVDANLQRWYGQFRQPDNSPTNEKVEKKEETVNGLKVTVVYVTGTYLKSAAAMMGGPNEELPGYAMLAAIVETGQSPWFFKATGPQATIDHWRPAFNEFVKTIEK